MIQIPAHCFEVTGHTGQKLVCEENGRSVVFIKPAGKAADKIRVDGCVLVNETACDYLVRDWKGRHYFVELKGKDVERALFQISETIPHFLEKPTSAAFWCLVVCTRTAPASRPGIQNQRARIIKKWTKAQIEIRSRQYTHTIV